MSNTAQWLHRARSLRASGRLREACEAYVKAANNDPNDINAWTELGATLNAANRPNDALRALARVGQINPQHVPALVELSRAEMKLGRPQRAAGVLQRAASLEPTNAAILRDFARALHFSNAGPASLPVIRRAVELAPDDAETNLTAGMLLTENRAAEQAVPFLRKSAALKPSALALASLGSALALLSQFDDAGKAVDQAAAIDPKFPGVPATRAMIAHALGNLDDATRIAEDAINAGFAPPDLIQRYAGLVSSMPEKRGAAIDLLRRAKERPETIPGSLPPVLYGLASLLDAQGDYEAAFSHAKEANSRVAPPFNPQTVRTRTDELKRLFSKANLEAAPKGDPACRRPAFIVGMPRSGTTLLERIIDAHPEAVGVGELDMVPRLFGALVARSDARGTLPASLGALTPALLGEFAKAYLDRISNTEPGTSRVVDKLPHNFLTLGFIALLFPGATLLHASRHPLDTCVSCFLTPLGRAHAYKFTLAGLAAEYTEYRRMMDHWNDVLGSRITHVVYENIVSSPQAEAQRIIASLGLPWNDACLAFHQSSGPVTTFSATQVRRPLYATSVNRWKNYEPYIGELIDGLRQFL